MRAMLHALSRQAIETGRSNVLPTHERRLVVAEFVGHNVDDVLPLSGERRKESTKAEEGDDEEFHGCKGR